MSSNNRDRGAAFERVLPEFPNEWHSPFQWSVPLSRSARQELPPIRNSGLPATCRKLCRSAARHVLDSAASRYAPNVDRDTHEIRSDEPADRGRPITYLLV